MTEAVGIPFPGTLAITIIGLIVVSLLGLGGLLWLGAFASVTTRAIAVGLLAMAVLFALYAYLFTRASLRIEVDEVVLDVPLYGRSINRDEVLSAGVRDLNLLDDSDHTPVIRTNGIGLPRFLVGWVRLRDGTKALAALTDRTAVVYLPLSNGTAMLVSVDDPARVVAALASPVAASLSRTSR